MVVNSPACRASLTGKSCSGKAAKRVDRLDDELLTRFATHQVRVDFAERLAVMRIVRVFVPTDDFVYHSIANFRSEYGRCKR